MKSMRNAKWIALFGFVALISLSCEKEDDPSPDEAINNQIQGEWEVNSYTEDGTEMIEYTVSSMEMDFASDGAVTGRCKWDIVYYNGTVEKLSFDYLIKDGGKTIELEGDDSDYEFDLELSGTKLELAGNIEGYRYEIVARK